jgi:hypothetical protein
MELRINIGSDFNSKAIIVDSEKTVKEAYRENNVSLAAGAIVTLNTRRLGADDLDKTLADLGVANNDYLTVSGKLNSAR